MKLNVIITGATGMVGEGVLHECLLHPNVNQVLVINRKPCGVQHPRLTEIIHGNFLDITPIQNKLVGYNACFFCLGVSSVGMGESTYRQLTYDLTLHVATILAAQNPDMTFCYVSGSGTDSTEKGKSMWARVKGKTENDLLKLPFKKVYLFRPGYMHPTPGLKNVLKGYKALAWMYPMLKWLFPNFVSTLKDVGQVMIHCAQHAEEASVLEVADINRLAQGLQPQSQFTTK